MLPWLEGEAAHRALPHAHLQEPDIELKPTILHFELLCTQRTISSEILHDIIVHSLTKYFFKYVYLVLDNDIIVLRKYCCRSVCEAEYLHLRGWAHSALVRRGRGRGPSTGLLRYR